MLLDSPLPGVKEGAAATGVMAVTGARAGAAETETTASSDWSAETAVMAGRVGQAVTEEEVETGAVSSCESKPTTQLTTIR